MDEEENFHSAFIRMVRKHFHFLELPGEAQLPWMFNFYENIRVPGLTTTVVCGYFSPFFRINFDWEPMNRSVTAIVRKLPDLPGEFGYLDQAVAQVQSPSSAQLGWLVALANPEYRSWINYQEVWYDDRAATVDDYLRSLADGMRPIVAKILGPHWQADPSQRPDFPFFEEVAALDLESFKSRLTPAQLEGSS